MSRSGYTDDGEGWGWIRWRGMVASAIRGKRGLALLRDLLAALDAMPKKRLIAHELESDGEVCALGAVGRHRGLDMKNLDPDEPEDVAAAFNIAACLAQEVVYENDERGQETPEERWIRMRAWVAEQLAPPKRQDYVSEEFYQKALAKWQSRQPARDGGSDVST